MPLSTVSRRRLLLPLLLAVVLAGEVAGLAAAARLGPTGAAAADDRPSQTNDAGNNAPDATSLASRDRAVHRERPALGARATSYHVHRPLGRAAAARPDVAPAARASATLVPNRPAGAMRSGRNHVWIPALGISRSVAVFPCSRSREPDDLIYRWGCSGRNNVYLMGHAHSVFKPLHDAYVNGRLRKGMEVIYADGNGRVRVYSVIWWRVTRPTAAASWAWASQAKPSMTLQTCVGANSQYRLMVRLVATG